MQKEELYIGYISKDVFITGTSTSATTNKLIDSGALFLTGATPVTKGDLATNTTNNTTALVESVDSETQLTLSSDIFPTSPTAYKVNKKKLQRIELIESLNPSLTFNVADIAKPDTRKADYSKTITLPGSKKLNKQFEHIFEVNLSLQTFNPNLKTDVIYLVDGEINLDGYLQLKQVNILDNDKVTYDCTIVGRLGDFVTDLGDKLLDDSTMLWGNLDHDYTLANQQASWTATTGYVYPIVDYGFNTGLVDWWVEELYPAIYAKEYIDRMFSASGYTYTSTFLTSAPFNKLIVPFNGQEFAVTGSVIEQRIFSSTVPNFQLTGSTSQSIDFSAFSSITNFYRVNMTVENDPNNVYDTTTGLYQCNATGTYNLYYELDLTATFSPIDYVTGVAPTFDTECIVAILGEMEMLRLDNAGNPIGGYNNTGVIGSKAFNISYAPVIPASTSSVSTVGTNPFDSNYIETVDSLAYQNYNYVQGPTAVWSTTDPRQFATPKKYILVVNDVFLNDTDQVKIRIKSNLFTQEVELNSINNIGAIGTPVPTTPTTPLFRKSPNANSYLDFARGTAELNLTAGVFRNSVSNKGYNEGNNIDMFSAIPKNIKQTDFFMSIVKMFNLYVQTDTANDRNLFIEPRDDFYNSNVNNWSQKLDISQPLEFLPMGALDSQRYLYTYKADKDYYNELYTTTWGEIYGERLKRINNDFLKNEHKTEVIFSPTPSVGQSYNDKVIPTIKKVDNNGQEVRTISNIRILYYGGLKDTVYTWTHQSDLVANQLETQYPYAGHYDDPFTPTIDINFGLTKEIYWDNTFNAITWTDNNLYNKYHSKFIDEITDVNSKIVRGWFYLKPGDIRKLSFREQYYFDGAYFRLNKIENYNPNNPLTKCEFLKLKDAEVFVPTTTTANGGVTALTTQENTPLFASAVSKSTDNNSIGNQKNDVQGVENYISKSSQNIQIQGDRNYIFDNARNITITGDNNRINSGVENVTLINTNDQTVINSNVTYVNGELKGDGSVVTISTSTTAETSVTTYEVDASGGVIVLTLPSSVNIGKVWNIKLIDETNECQVLTAGTETIDGFTDIKITQLNTTISIQYDGLNFIII